MNKHLLILLYTSLLMNVSILTLNASVFTYLFIN